MIFNLIVPEIKLPSPPITYITFSSPNSFILKTKKNWDGTLEYSTDTDTWSTWDGTTTLNSGSDNKLYLRGIGNTKITGTWKDNPSWVLTGSNISCDGNIEYLLDYQTVLKGEHPTMGNYCYEDMFKDCTSLTTVPELPATTLTTGCYEEMFRGCTSLTTAPELSAINLANFCYNSMFQGCTSLITAPNLPATTLADECYTNMFSGCTALTKAPELPATTLTIGCYKSMFEDCTSLITAPKLPATKLYSNCYNSMFDGCKSLTAIPALPVTNLQSQCYYHMFWYCTKIKLSATKTGTYTQEYRIPTSGAGITATNALDSMFIGTGGTFKGTPEINTTYYLDSSNTII